MADVTKMGATSPTTPWLPNTGIALYDTSAAPNLDIKGGPEVYAVDYMTMLTATITGITANTAGEIVVETDTMLRYEGTVTNAAPTFSVGTVSDGPTANEATLPISTTEVSLSSRANHNQGKN